MKKIFALLIVFLIITSCDEAPDNLIDSVVPEIQVLNINVPGFIKYQDENTSLKVSLKVNDKSSIERLWCSILSLDGEIDVASSVELLDDGDTPVSGDVFENDNEFTGKVNLSNQIPNGIYAVDFYLLPIGGKSKKIVVSSFRYDNSQQNFPPVISNLTAPDTVIVQDPRSLILMSLEATDENGQQDIKEVFFTIVNPDSSSDLDKLFLDDTGDFFFGDEIAGDGIYSVIIQVTPENQKGKYQFTFHAVDREGESSNSILHIIYIL
ncbi:hypothetical protein ACFLS9_02020 [Bacteroidota bacterium]